MTTSKTSDASNLLEMVSFEILKQVGFFDTKLASAFKSTPVCLLDVGARWGVQSLFQPIAPLVEVVSFEPDEAEAKRVHELESRQSAWAGFNVYPYALGDKDGTAVLNLLRRANNSSIFPVNEHCYERYKLAGFELEKKIDVPVHKLDSLVTSGKITQLNAGEILKMDTQGAELAILFGGKNTVTANTACVICEAAFFTPYVGASVFTDIAPYLQSLGFSFYGFVDFKFRSTKRLDKKQSQGRERMMQADAVFFRDPFDDHPPHHQPTERQIQVVFLMALLLGYFDFCLEIIDHWDLSSAERAALTDAARGLAYRSPTDSAREISSIAEAIAANPSTAVVQVGRLIDRQRDYFSFQDIQD